RITGDLKAADKLRRQTEEAIATYEQALAEAKARAHGIAKDARNKLKEEVATERVALEQDLAKKSAEAEARIHQAKESAHKGVSGGGAEPARKIVQRLSGAPPAKPEVSAAVAAARKE